MSYYKKVEAFKTKHPTSTLANALKKTGVSHAQYYRDRPAPKKRRTASVKYARQVVRGTPPPASPAPQVTVIMGTPDQIRAVLG